VSVCESNEIAIPPVKKRKVSSRTDESASSQYFVQTKEEKMKISCYYPLLDNLLTGVNRIFEQGTVRIITVIGRMLNTEKMKM
jgi:hypothetical protein